MRHSSQIIILLSRYLAVSFMTVAELFEWSAVRKWGQTRLVQLEQTLATYLIIPVDIELCRLWGVLRAEQRCQAIIAVTVGLTVRPTTGSSQ